MLPIHRTLKLFILSFFVCALFLLAGISEWLTTRGAAAGATEGAFAGFPVEEKNFAATAEFFEQRIRPVLANNCFSCHSDAAKGGLRLDSRDALLKGGASGPAIIPGEPEESLLIEAITHTHARLRMPKGTNKLPNTEINDLILWVRHGAFWPETPQDFFAARILPVLQNNCFACHTDEPMAKLRLDSRAAILKGGTSGAALIPGNPDKSLLIQSLRYTHPRLKMPPAKKLPDEVIADFEKWVKDGAVWAGKPGAMAASKEYVITTEQKAHWAYQPLRTSAVARNVNGRTFRHAIDYFIEEKLREKGLKQLGAADKGTLIRRATFDLIGLPPTPEEVDAFLNDHSPNAFEKVVDRLLASPHYGERQARYWLDLVRYSDTAGDSSDYPIPQMYRYRNYVIDAFNRNKPYDQFIREQLAGDLLPAGNEAEKWEQTVATGYIAVSRRFSVLPENYMHLTIDDTIDNVSKTFLGLTVSCARCHDHKYDPLSSRDYYAMYGFFASTRYPFAGSENKQRQDDLITRLPKEEADKILKPWTDQLDAIDKRQEFLKKERRFVETGVVPGNENDFVKSTRTKQQIDAEAKELRDKRRTLALQVPQIERAFAVAEDKPRNAPILLRGEPRNKGEVVPRRFLQILGGQPLPGDCQNSGRLQLAEWIVDAKNPLTARVMVNRLWQQHFGRGIVASTSDFGWRGKKPTHPELLDYLAARFIESKWSIKAMHRMIMLSQTYQLASAEPQEPAQKTMGNSRSLRANGGNEKARQQLTANNAAIDVNNEYLWRFNGRRLEAEAIRDTLLYISGELDSTVGGRGHTFPHESQWNYTQHNPFNKVHDSKAYDSNRRSIYLMTQRIQRHPYLAIFDGADTNTHTPERAASTTPIQALFMMNSEFLHAQADSFAARLLKASPDDRQRLITAWRMALGRAPSAEELERSLTYLGQSTEKLAASGVKPETLPQRAMASLLRVLLSSNEFVFVD